MNMLHYQVDFVEINEETWERRGKYVPNVNKKEYEKIVATLRLILET